MVEATEAAQATDSGPRFEKYFDENYGRAYYFDKSTGESIWVLPEGTNEETDVLDCCQKVEEENREEDKQSEKEQVDQSKTD